jgi:hypothetical protein
MAVTSMEKRIATIVRLLSPYENRLGDNRPLLIQCFLDALGDYSDSQVHDGYRYLVSGKLESFRGVFPPSPTQLANACREALEIALDSAARSRARVPVPPPVPKSPESKRLVGELVEATVKRLSAA